MSRDFHFECRTCDPDRTAAGYDHTGWGRGHDFNWKGDVLLNLLPHFPLLTQLMAAGLDVDPQSLDLFQAPHGLAEYAQAHAGHDVQVWDEYNSRWLGGETCDELTACPTCTVRARCLLPRNHDGDHNPLKPTDKDPLTAHRAQQQALAAVKAAYEALCVSRARVSFDPGDSFDLEAAVGVLVKAIDTP